MDETQFTERVTRSRDKLFRIAYTILRSEPDCADALQEALLKAWKNLDKLREESYFDTWLVRILINECKRLCVARRKGYIPVVPILPVEDMPVHDALACLDEKYRLPIALHYLEGYSLDEIAYLTRVPVGTVKSRMHAGRKALKEILEEEG